MSILAVSVQVYGAPRLATHIPAGSFYPPPKVDFRRAGDRSLPEPLVPAEQIDSFFRLVKAGFSQKRKNLRNALRGGMGIGSAPVDDLLTAAEIDPRRRAETLSLVEWGRLTDVFCRGND